MKDEIFSSLQKASLKIFPEFTGNFQVTKPQDSLHGDWSSNIALIMAKEMKKKDMNTMMSLEKDKYYVIISELPDDQFHLVAYDTTGKKYKTFEDHTVASIMHEGVMALLRRRGDEVFRCGEAEIEFNFSAKELQIEYQDETGEKLDLPENVVKIDFGKEQ